MALITFGVTRSYVNNLTKSVEYNGFLGVEAKYYEAWETWVVKECSREVPCGENCTTDSNGNTTCTTIYCTEYYDCSYCDENSAYWDVVSNSGLDHRITQDYFNILSKQWSSKPKFNELDRKIKKQNGCGFDGDMYNIKWDKKPETSEGIVTHKHYKNKIKGSKSTFNYKEFTIEEKNKIGLYEYPKPYSFYKQNPILGIDSLNIHNKDTIIKKFEYLNGKGSTTLNKTFILLYKDKPIDIAFKQEQMWLGGNRNELNICIGYNSETKKMDWVKAFSWTDNKKIMVDVREELMSIDTLDLNRFYPIIDSLVTKGFKPKSFKEFDYIEDPEYPNGMYWGLFILSLALSIGWVILYLKYDFDY